MTFCNSTFGLWAGKEVAVVPWMLGTKHLYTYTVVLLPISAYAYILANMEARVGCELLPLATDLLVTRAMPFPLLDAGVAEDCDLDFLEAVDYKERVAALTSLSLATTVLTPNTIKSQYT